MKGKTVFHPATYIFYTVSTPKLSNIYFRFSADPMISIKGMRWGIPNTFIFYPIYIPAMHKYMNHECTQKIYIRFNFFCRYFCMVWVTDNLFIQFSDEFNFHSLIWCEIDNFFSNENMSNEKLTLSLLSFLSLCRCFHSLVVVVTLSLFLLSSRCCHYLVVVVTLLTLLSLCRCWQSLVVVCHSVVAVTLLSLLSLSYRCLSLLPCHCCYSLDVVTLLSLFVTLLSVLSICRWCQFCYVVIGTVVVVTLLPLLSLCRCCYSLAVIATLSLLAVSCCCHSLVVVVTLFSLYNTESE